MVQLIWREDRHLGKKARGGHIKDLEEYSGPHKPDAKFADFSKHTLAKLLEGYQKTLCGTDGNV